MIKMNQVNPFKSGKSWFAFLFLFFSTAALMAHYSQQKKYYYPYSPI